LVNGNIAPRNIHVFSPQAYVPGDFFLSSVSSAAARVLLFFGAIKDMLTFQTPMYNNRNDDAEELDVYTNQFRDAINNTNIAE